MVGNGRAKAVLSAFCAVAVLSAWAPAAGADQEPNSSVFQPETLTAGGADVVGAIGGGDRDDWYAFEVEGRHQLHLRSPQGEGSDCVFVGLADADGVQIPPDYTTPAGRSRFFVHVRPRFGSPPPGCATGSPYSFRIDPADAVAADPAITPTRGTREPNETRAEAFGPLTAGAWFYGALETANDRDWLVFYTAPRRHALDVQVVTREAPGPGGPLHCAQSIVLADARGREIDSPSGDDGVVEHLRLPSRGPRKLHVRITGDGSPGCVSSSWAVQVAPADAVLGKGQVRAGCAKGRKASRRWSRRVAADRRAIARAGKPAPRALRRKLTRDKRKLRSARRATSAYCP